MKALLIVDLQNDFLPGGPLPAKEGNKIIPTINALMEKFPIVLASKDWHPEESEHFKEWPPHCIRNTKGAEFPPELENTNIQKVFLKGTNDKDDGYSAFEATNFDLHQYLQKAKVDKLCIAGLTTEYCVKNTAKDAVKNGYLTYVVKDAIAPVEREEGDEKKALEAMEKYGAEVIDSHQVII